MKIVLKDIIRIFTLKLSMNKKYNLYLKDLYS